MRTTLFVTVLFVITSWQTIAQIESQANLHTSKSSSSSLVGNNGTQRKTIIITGIRFVYPLIQKWIDDYTLSHPDIQLVIEWRGSSDPASDILIEAYEPVESIRNDREYLYVANYAVLPIANQNSPFAKVYSERGLTRNLIKQLYFHDPFLSTQEEVKIKEPYTIYTRLQKAGAPIVFTHYFGYEQKDIRGKAIAGSDEHLLKAVLRDSLAVSYLPLPLVYDLKSLNPHEGLIVFPVDLNDNDKVSESEKIFTNLATVVKELETNPRMKNIPTEVIHLSIDRASASYEAIEFLLWISQNGGPDLHTLGYLSHRKQAENKKFEEFALKRLP